MSRNTVTGGNRPNANLCHLRGRVSAGAALRVKGLSDGGHRRRRAYEGIATQDGDHA